MHQAMDFYGLTLIRICYNQMSMIKSILIIGGGHEHNNK